MYHVSTFVCATHGILHTLLLSFSSLHIYITHSRSLLLLPIYIHVTHTLTLLLLYILYTYGVATISRLLKIIGLFCRILSLLQGSFAKETCNFKEADNCSHPIVCSTSQRLCVLHAEYYTHSHFTYHILHTLTFFLLLIYVHHTHSHSPSLPYTYKSHTHTVLLLYIIYT